MPLKNRFIKTFLCLFSLLILTLSQTIKHKLKVFLV